MKDPTRGGFANAINEMASKSGVGVVLEQDVNMILMFIIVIFRIILTFIIQP